MIENAAGWQEKLNSYLTPKRQRLVLLVLLIIYALMLSYKINEPFMRPSDELNSIYGIAAWNWLIHGPVELKFAMMTLVRNVGVALPGAARMFFLNHPSFFIAPTAVLYGLFGVGEWQTRASSVIFSLLSLIVFWKLIARVFKTPWLTVASSLFYALFPVGIFYGGLLTHDHIALFLILSLFLALVLFEQEKRGRYFFAVLALVFLGGLSDWTFFFAAASAWLYIALTKDYPRKKILLPLVAGVLAASLSITLLQIWSIAHMNPFAYLKAVFLNRNATDVGSLTLPRLINMRLNFDLIGFSEIGLLLAAAGAVFYFAANKKFRAKILFLLLLAGPGLLTYSVFYKHSTAEQFYGLYIMPAIALLAAYGIGLLRKVRHAGPVFLLFVLSCAWYAAILFAYTQFAPDDFALFRRANAALPASATVCTDSLNSKFYLSPLREADDVPCPDFSYFLLRSPQSREKTYLLFSLTQTFYTDDFRENARRIAFSEAVGMEIVKSVPAFKQKLGAVFAAHDPRKDSANAAKNAQAFIDKYKLRPVDCSTNFCLYEKSELPLR